MSGSVGVVGDCDSSLPSITGSFQNQQRKRGIAALLDVSNQVDPAIPGPSKREEGQKG